MSQWAALSVSLILVLHILQRKVTLLIGDFLMQVVAVVSVNCWGVLWEFMYCLVD